MQNRIWYPLFTDFKSHCFGKQPLSGYQEYELQASGIWTLGQCPVLSTEFWGRKGLLRWIHWVVLKNEQSTGKHFLHPCWLKGVVVFCGQVKWGSTKPPLGDLRALLLCHTESLRQCAPFTSESTKIPWDHSVSCFCSLECCCAAFWREGALWEPALAGPEEFCVCRDQVSSAPAGSPSQAGSTQEQIFPKSSSLGCCRGDQDMGTQLFPLWARCLSVYLSVWAPRTQDCQGRSWAVLESPCAWARCKKQP